MSKAIKIDEADWQTLRSLQSGGETFAQSIHQLLAIQEGVHQFITEVELLPSYRKYRIKHPEMGVKEGG